MVDILSRWISLCQVALKGFGICGVGMATGFCILGAALSVVGLRGDFKRGIIWNGEGGMKAICVYLCAWVCMRERERARPCFSGRFGQCAKTHRGAQMHGPFFEKAACISFAQISPNPSHLNLSPPQSACQQINTIHKDNSLTEISQISERPREDTSPKPRLSPQIWSLRPS